MALSMVLNSGYSSSYCVECVDGLLQRIDYAQHIDKEAILLSALCSKDKLSNMNGVGAKKI